MLKSSLVILILALGPALCPAQSPVRLDAGDVYFQFRPAASYKPAASNTTYDSTRPAMGLCGFNIRGNHNSRANPRVEWDLNIDELMAGSTRVAGVSAGTFNVVGHERKPKPPIVQLIFSVESDAEVIPAEIVGPPNADNAIKALLQEARANKLFTAFSEAKTVTISLHYADATADLLQIQGWRFGSGKNSDFNQCLRGYTPRITELRTIK